MKTVSKIALWLPLCGLAACQDEPVKPARTISVDAASVSAATPLVPPLPVPVSTVPKIEMPAKISKQEFEMPKTSKEAIQLARQLLKDGDKEGARKVARRGTQLGPQNFLTWNTLGRVELELNHGKEAQEAFQKALEIQPDSAFAHNNLGLAYLYEDRWDEARIELEAATSSPDPKPYMWNNLGVALEHLDRLDEARNAYEKAADGGAINSKESIARLAGVKTIKTAKATKVEPTPDSPNSNGGTIQ